MPNNVIIINCNIEINRGSKVEFFLKIKKNNKKLNSHITKTLLSKIYIWATFFYLFSDDKIFFLME